MNALLASRFTGTRAVFSEEKLHVIDLFTDLFIF